MIAPRSGPPTEGSPREECPAPRPIASHRQDRQPGMSMSHDQNFNNLILDYPLDAMGFSAQAEATAVEADVRILPIR